VRREVTRGLWVAALASASACGPRVQGDAASRTLPWIVGAWHHIESGATTEEQWVAAPDGSLLGTGRVLVRGTIIGFSETLHIGDGPGGLTLTTWVGGQEPVHFVADSVTADTATFRNVRHDFPQVITYRRTAEGTLQAKATGKNPDGSPREESWTLNAGAPPQAPPSPEESQGPTP
jgi:hypothetical protein